MKKCETGHAMFKLASVFERKSIFNKLYLKRQLLEMKCGKGDKLQDHFIKFDNIMTSLESMGSKIDESDKVCHLLLTMNEDYDNVLLETMDKDLDINFVKAKLLDAEMKIQNKEREESTFFTCYKCGKGLKSYECKKNMRGRRPYQRRGNRFITRWRPHGSRSTTTNIMNERNDLVFIVDSGASHHFIQEKYESRMKDIKELSKAITITIEGLIVPGLKHNHLSVSKLMEKGAKVIFRNKRLKIASLRNTYFEEKF